MSQAFNFASFIIRLQTQTELELEADVLDSKFGTNWSLKESNKFDLNLSLNKTEKIKKQIAICC